MCLWRKLLASLRRESRVIWERMAELLLKHSRLPDWIREPLRIRKETLKIARGEGAGSISSAEAHRLALNGARLLQLGPEFTGPDGQAKGLELERAARWVLADENEVPQVRHEHHRIPIPVAAELIPCAVSQALSSRPFTSMTPRSGTRTRRDPHVCTCFAV